MDAKLVNPFVDACTAVMPQIGFDTPKRTKIYLRDKNAISRGVTVMVGFTKQLRGNVVYNMDEEAVNVVEMMMGMQINEFDAMAQSAISEMSNMITAKAATNLTKLGLEVDISTPSLTVGKNFSFKITDGQYLTVDMDIGGHTIELDIAVDRD